MGTIYPFSDVKQRMTPSHKSTQITPSWISVFIDFVHVLWQPRTFLLRISNQIFWTSLQHPRDT